MTPSAHPSATPGPMHFRTPFQTAVIVLALCLSAAVGTELIPAIAARVGALFLFAVQIGYEIRRGEHSFLFSPVFLLAAAALALFSLFPNALFVFFQQFDDSEPGSDIFMGTVYRQEILSYFGRRAETLVLSFSAAALAVHGGTRWLLNSGVATGNDTPIGRDRRPQLLLVCSALLAVVFLVATQSSALGSSVTGLLRTVVPPVQSFLLVYLLHAAVVRKHVGVVPVLLLVAANVAIMILAHGGKIPALIVLAVTMYYLAISRISFARLGKAVLMFAIFVFICLQVVQVIRSPNASVIGENNTFLQNLSTVFIAKLIWRQLETGYCLDNVVERHRFEGFQLSRQTFWLEILIPRAVWPRKLNYSLGNEYAIEYCGIPDAPDHSASITLLGQPLIYGGVPALVLHGGILLLVLGTAGAVSMSRPGLPRIVIFALLPWWIDFDQDFALYAGNIVKFGICMLPFVLFASDRFGRLFGKSDNSAY